MTASLYKIPFHTCLLRAILRPIFRGIFHLLSDVQISGRGNVPKSGAYLIAINHISTFDVPFALAFWPAAPEAAGAVEIWSRPGQSLLARWYGGIPIHRGEYDRKLLETMLNALRAGKSLMIAPEGSRSHTPGLRRALPGAAYLADQAGVPLVPVGIVGATDDFLERGLHGGRPKIEMHIGQLFSLPPVEGKGEARRAARQRNADLVMCQIANLLPSNYRGIYASGIPADD